MTRLTAQDRPDNRMNDELLLVLRDRVASRYYERMEVIDAVARALLRSAARLPA